MRDYTLEQNDQTKQKFLKNKLKILSDATRPGDIVVFDTETTGFGKNDEILQFSMVNGAGQELLNKYYYPHNVTDWSQAASIHHIDKQFLAEHNILDNDQYYLNNPGNSFEVTSYLSNAKYIIGYNIKYDLRMLQQSLWQPMIFNNQTILDVMLDFAPIYGEINPRYHSYKWQSLSTCADYFNYDWGSSHAHDSMADTKATLFCAKSLYEIPDWTNSYEESKRKLQQMNKKIFGRI